MKVSLFLLLLLIPQGYASAQKYKSNIDGFFDIKWGESSDIVQNKMLEREGISLNPNSPYEDKEIGEKCLYFNKGSFLGMGVDHWNLEFLDDKLFNVTISIRGLNETMFCIDYFEIIDILTLKYGRSTKTDISEKEYTKKQQQLLFKVNSKGKGGVTYWFLSKSSISIYAGKEFTNPNETLYHISISLCQENMEKQMQERKQRRKLKDIN